MFNISQKEYEKKLKNIQKKNKTLKYKQKLDKEKYKYKNKLKLPSTSKLMVVYLFILLNIIVVYSMIAMWKFEDLSYLSVLITDIAAQIVTFITYTIKSTKENTAGGIIFETAMRQELYNNGDFNISEEPDENEEEYEN